jgi:hypothetical protein
MRYAGCSDVSLRYDGLVTCEIVLTRWLLMTVSGFDPYRERYKYIENIILRNVYEPKGTELKRKHTKVLLKGPILLLFTNSFKMFI